MKERFPTLSARDRRRRTPASSSTRSRRRRSSAFRNSPSSNRSRPCATASTSSASPSRSSSAGRRSILVQLPGEPGPAARQGHHRQDGHPRVQAARGKQDRGQRARRGRPLPPARSRTGPGAGARSLACGRRPGGALRHGDRAALRTQSPGRLPGREEDADDRRRDRRRAAAAGHERAWISRRLSFNARGAKLFEDITAKNVGRRLAIVLDDTVYSAPVIRERITGGRAVDHRQLRHRRGARPGHRAARRRAAGAGADRRGAHRRAVARPGLDPSGDAVLRGRRRAGRRVHG